jgi:FKBP-type peptidyl-prolyl cis-trans isomerase SlyD
LKIGKNTVVELKFALKESNGVALESSQEAVGYLHGGYTGIFPAVEERLEGLDEGAEVEVRLTPADAFGEYDETLKRTEPKSAFPRNIKVGMRFEGKGATSGETHIYTITAIKGDKVEVDGNHPYAGKTIDFRCQVVSVRPASSEEIAHGHVHGPGGHHH